MAGQVKIAAKIPWSEPTKEHLIHMDEATRSLYTIDIEHALIHEGRTFTHNGQITVPASGVFDHLFIIPTTAIAHLHRFSVVADAAPLDIFLYENTIVSSNGTPHPSYNKNRRSSRVNAANWYHTPTITTLGTQIDYYRIAGTKQTGGIGAEGFDEWPLNENYKYLIRLSNPTAQPVIVEYQSGWYELQQP